MRKTSETVVDQENRARLLAAATELEGSVE
jgi:hypothetical protein